MQDPIDIFLNEPTSATERKALIRAMANDDQLREVVEAWARADDAMRRRWEDALPDRRLLVLWAFERAGRAAELTPDEQQMLEARRSEIEAVREQFVAVDDIAVDVEACCSVFDRLWAERAESSVGKGRETQARDRSAIRSRTSRRNVRWLWRIPAAVAVVAFIAVSVLVLERDMFEGRDGFEVVSTGVDEVRIVSMDDGSSVRLMPNSRLSYVPVDRQSPVNRKARLEGRAYFDVASQQTGLLIETPTATATVLGTSFGIEALDAETKVALVDGKLAVAGNIDRRRAVTLEPGQLSRVPADGLPSAPEAVNLAEYLEWTGMFIFRAEPISAVVESLTRHFNVSITVDDALAGERITGTFEQSDSLETILDVVAAALDASVDRTDTGFRLRAR